MQLVGSSTVLESVVVNNGSTAYVFSTTATAGDSYQIKISDQPTSNWQECVFSATGTDTITIGPLTGSTLDNGDTSCIDSDHFEQLVCDSSTERSYVGAPVAFREKTFALRLPDAEYGPLAIRIDSGAYYCTGGWGLTTLDLFKTNQTTGLKLADIDVET